MNRPAPVGFTPDPEAPQHPTTGHLSTLTGWALIGGTSALILHGLLPWLQH